MYKAAGLLPMSINSDGEVVVLLGIEFREKKLYLIDVGGRIEPHDCNSSWVTANREFMEETGYPGFLQETLIETVIIKKCKYVFHIVYCDFVPMIPKNTGPDTISDLIWVRLSDLLQIDMKIKLPLYKSIPIHNRLKDVIHAL